MTQAAGITGVPLARMDVEEAGYSTPILRGVRLALGEGQTVLLAGPSGSGKTTILLALTGVLKALLGGYVRGAVELAGVNPLEPSGFERVPSLVGVALQDPDRQLAMTTPIDEVMFTLENLGYPRGEAERRAIELLREFGLEGKAFAEVENLSGGEKRRLTFAASIAHDPVILLLDEPTASVDPWGVGVVREFVSRVKGEKGVIIVEHKARFFLDLVDSIILVKDGTVRGAWEAGEVDVGELEAAGVDAGPPTLRSPPVEPGDVVFSFNGVVKGPGVELQVEDFNVRRGELVALVGPNGAGKTTMLKALSGIAKAHGDLKCLKPPGGRCAFYMPQNPDYIFMYPTVGEEAARSGRGGLVDPRGEEVVRLYGKLSPYRLSHGQRRWLSLSITLSYPAAVYMLDEPTTGLDAGLYSEFLSRLTRAMRRGASFVVATHDARVIGDIASRVYTIRGSVVREEDRGRILAELEQAWVSGHA